MSDMDPADPELRPLLLTFFTEVAMLEHLARNHFSGQVQGELDAGRFGVLNYFSRTKLTREREATLAWCFQDDDSHMAAKINALSDAGFVDVEGPESDRVVLFTDAGRAAHERALELIAPEVGDLLVGLSKAEMQTTVRVLQEVRRTFDNLPGRV
jgi:DNA-binding MarR family transcriptional regulator